MQQWIGLLDCNNFFVSCERLFRPDLKGKPVLVLSSNDGCVVARSQEVKDKGISMGVPHFKIKDTIKDIGAVTFSSNFTLYRDISRRVFEVMRVELETIEQYSIDEAFFVFSGTPENALSLAMSLKARVEQVVGIPVSVGIASSKTQAKYANNVAKKTTGTFVLDAKTWNERVSEIKLGEIWGVGFKMTDQFRRHNLVTVADLLQADPSRLDVLFGVVAKRLCRELQGVPSLPVTRRFDSQKSITSSRSFKDPTNDISVLKDAIAYHLRSVCADLRLVGLKASDMQVSMLPSRFGDFMLQGGSLRTILTSPSNDTLELLKIAQNLVDQIFIPDVPYKKVGVLLSNLTPARITQLNMFDVPAKTKTADLMAVIDAINKRAGRDSVLLGSHLQTTAWQASKKSLSPSYTTNWNALVTVKA